MSGGVLEGSNVDLGEILGFLAAADARALQGIGGDGQLDFNLDVRGSLAPGAVPAVTGTLALKNGRVKYASAPASIDAIVTSRSMTAASRAAAAVRASSCSTSQRPRNSGVSMPRSLIRSPPTRIVSPSTTRICNVLSTFISCRDRARSVES